MIAIRTTAVALSVAVILALAARPRFALAATPTADECATASETAQVARKSGQLLRSREQFALCASRSCPRVVAVDCEAQLAALVPAIPSVVLRVHGSDGAAPTSMRVTLDGRALDAKQLGAPLDLDPGSHALSVEADGSIPEARTFVLGEGERERAVDVVLRTAVDGVLRSAARAAPTAPPAAPPPSGVPVLAYAGIGTAAVGVVVGSVFTALTVHAKDTANAACPLPGDGCPPGVDPGPYNRSITENQVAAGVAFGVAVVGGVIGLVSLLSSGGSSQTAWVTPFGVSGSFE
jgi:hypothetical protein